MKFRNLRSLIVLTLVTALIIITHPIYACTIVSAIAKNGHVWTANNEDGPYGVANFINVFPKTEDAKYGYYTLSYLSPTLGNGGFIQGGMNQSGLTFDFNAIDFVEGFDVKNKKPFPKGDDAILPHLLANMSTVAEVIEFFTEYWFQNGFTSAQMHVADKQGNFAIISASGIEVAKKGQPMVSTNFDVCGKENSSSCWRYPIAISKLQTQEIGLMTMISIALETAQKNGSTMYSNIQNLSTGELWLFSQHDPNVIVHTNIDTLISKGKKSYTFSDLKSIYETEKQYIRSNFKPIKIENTTKKQFIGNYHNSFIGNVIVKLHEDGLEIEFSDGNRSVFNPKKKNEYFISEADVFIIFEFDEVANQMAMKLYENGLWSVTAWKSN